MLKNQTDIDIECVILKNNEAVFVTVQAWLLLIILRLLYIVGWCSRMNRTCMDSELCPPEKWRRYIHGFIAHEYKCNIYHIQFIFIEANKIQLTHSPMNWTSSTILTRFLYHKSLANKIHNIPIWWGTTDGHWWM